MSCDIINKDLIYILISEKEEGDDMFEQDYVMRMIRELVRTILKLLFHIDDVDDSIIIDDVEAKELYCSILGLIKQYRINEAENNLLEQLDVQNLDMLKVSLLFYDRLNQMSDKELEEAEFSREEVKDGIQTVLKQYGYNGITNAF